MSLESTKYLKRIQAWVNPRLKSEGLTGVTYDQIRTVWFDQSIVMNSEEPTEEEYIKARQTVLENMMSIKNQPEVEELAVYTDGSIEFESIDNTQNQVLHNEEKEKSYESVLTAIELVDEWLSDDSNYDEKHYPQIEQALIENRVSNSDIDHIDIDKEEEETNDQNSGSMVPVEPTTPSSLSTEVNNNNIIDIRSIVEQQFSDKGSEVQEMIIQYAENKMYTNVQELQEALTDINNTELSVMLKVSDDYIKQREHNQQTIQQHLKQNTELEQKKSQIRAMQRMQKMSHYRGQFGVLS